MNEYSLERTVNQSSLHDNQSSLRDFCFILFKHKKAAIYFFIAVMIAAALFTFVSPEVYRSEATLLVRLGRENATLDPTATTGQIVNVGQNRTIEMNSELEIIKSRELAERVVDALGADFFQNGSQPDSSGEAASKFASIQNLAKHKTTSVLTTIGQYLGFSNAPDPRQEQEEFQRTVDEVAGSLDAEGIAESSIITVAYEAENPALAHNVLEKLIGFYLDKHITVHRSGGSYEFFTEQTSGLRSSLAETSEKLKALKNESGIASLEEQRSILLERIGALQSAHNAAESEINATEARVKALKAQLRDVPKSVVTMETTGATGSASEELRKQLYLLQMKEQELLSTYTPTSVPVVEIRRQIREAENFLSQAGENPIVAKGVNPSYQTLSLTIVQEGSNLKSLASKAAKLKDQLAQAREDLKSLNNNEIKLATLRRDLEIQEANYRKYTEGLEQARIDHALEIEKISNVSIAQAATMPVDPIRPRKGFTLFVGFFFGIIGALGLAFFLAYMDHSFTKPEDVEQRLGLQTLATLPYFSDNEQHQKLALGKHTYLQLPVENILPVNVALPRDIADGDTSLMEQHFDTLNSVFFQNWKDSQSMPRTIAVTSSHSGEGVSTVSVYLASVLHQQFSGRVLLIDAKFQNPSLHTNLGARLCPGLADILTNKHCFATAFQKTTMVDLDFLSAGEDQIDFRWVERSAFAKLLQALKQKYDFVVIDTPPLWNGAAAGNLETLTDGVILVIEAEGVRWEVAQRAKRRLEKTNANILGVVLNKRRYHIPEWLYAKL